MGMPKCYHYIKQKILTKLTKSKFLNSGNSPQIPKIYLKTLNLNKYSEHCDAIITLNLSPVPQYWETKGLKSERKEAIK